MVRDPDVVVLKRQVLALQTVAFALLDASRKLIVGQGAGRMLEPAEQRTLRELQRLDEVLSKAFCP